MKSSTRGGQIFPKKLFLNNCLNYTKQGTWIYIQVARQKTKTKNMNCMSHKKLQKLTNLQQ